MLVIQDLTKNFGASQVLKGVNLSLERGQLKVIMGPSGSGKSTLLRCINRLVDLTSGSIHFNGVDVYSTSTDLRILRQRIGFVFQQFALYRHLTVLENITLALEKVKRLKPVQATARAEAELERFEMSEHRNKYPAMLSGGQKQRVALARALAGDPDLLLLDEPTSALDPILANDVARLVRKLRSEGVSMLCVTHDLNFAKRISEEVSFMTQGSIVCEGNLSDLRKRHDPHLNQFFREQEID